MDLIEQFTPGESVDPSKKIAVFILVPHSLAARYFHEVIAQTKTGFVPVRVSSINDVAAMPDTRQAVALIDLAGLTLPIGEYVDAFSSALPGCFFLATDRPKDSIAVARLLLMGFSGFITHDQVPESLERALNAVANGLIWASREVMSIYRNMTSRRRSFEYGAEVLTNRENEIFELLQSRCSNKEIALLLRISEGTVKFHVSNVLAKLNIKCRREVSNVVAGIDQLAPGQPFKLNNPRL